MLAAINRCGSFVEFSLITVNATCPGLISFNPSLRDINLQFGGKIEDTLTMLHAAIPAFRSASSKLDSRSRCFPTPLVRKIFLATNAIAASARLPEEFLSRKSSRLLKSNKKVQHCQSNTNTSTPMFSFYDTPVFEFESPPAAALEALSVSCSSLLCELFASALVSSLIFQLLTFNFQLPLSLPRQILHHSPQRPAQRQHLSQILRRKVRPAKRRARPFPAHLHHSHHFPVKQYRRAHNLMNRFSRSRRCPHSLKHARVPHSRKIVVNLRPAFPCRPRRQRRIARQRDVPHILQRRRHQKMQVPPSCGHRQDRQLIASHS